MYNTTDILAQLNQQSRALFQTRQALLSFAGFLELVQKNPRGMIRNSPAYLKDTFEYFGSRKVNGKGIETTRWQLFDTGTERHVPIVGSETVQDEIYSYLCSFDRLGYPNKLILLHGPNGSAKSSIIESVGCAMRQYSETDEGAVYRFNWIFPTDKSTVPQVSGEAGPIGFLKETGSRNSQLAASFALLDESKIASKIHSEFKENPIFLIPMPQREIWLREMIAAREGIKPEDVELPPHILLSGLSKRNQLILENLLGAYDGDLTMVLRHVQVERFFYSRQYRIGVGTVEPQMSIDAGEKQLTMDRNIANLPPVLHNISFFETGGPLVEANRGIIEFSDMLKRPIEAFKYLLSTVEKGTLNLITSTANIDVVFFGTTNEKHLDAFKTLPDFASFKSRFELVTAPYLLTAQEEEQIYASDVKTLGKLKPIAPHTMRLLATWAVMTRLKQPEPEHYDSKYRALITRLDPRSKLKLYEGKSLSPVFKEDEEQVLKELTADLIEEYQNTIVYEGRFGASPREVRSILYKAAQYPRHATITPMTIFDALEVLVKDRSVYEFLQFEPKGRYHQPAEFIKALQAEFASEFEYEVTVAMELVEEQQYASLLSRYVENVVAQVKKEKIYNKATQSYDEPNESLMKEVEKILNISGAIEKHRDSLLGKIAAYKLDHPQDAMDLAKVFQEHLSAIQKYYYKERQVVVENTCKAMLVLETDELRKFDEKTIALARTTYQNLERRFGYDPVSAKECLKFMMQWRAQRAS